MCGSHYERMRSTGDARPEKPLRARSGEPIAWIERQKDYDQDVCLFWPYSRNNKGYGVVQHPRTTVAHRLMCMIAHGDPPSPSHQAAHTCGKGQDGCMNPRHIRWATAGENQHDRVGHGTSNRGKGAKLSTADVRTIRRRLERGEQPTVIARAYGVSRITVHDIKAGRSWAWLD